MRWIANALLCSGFVDWITLALALQNEVSDLTFGSRTTARCLSGLGQRNRSRMPLGSTSTRVGADGITVQLWADRRPHNLILFGKCGSPMRSPPFVSELASSPNFEEHCAIYLVRLRWPDFVLCIRCKGKRVFRFERRTPNGMVRHLFECLDCHYQFSATTGTMFHHSHLSLTKWFLAIQRICSATRRVAAKQLERELAVSYETALKFVRPIRAPMEEHGAFRSKFSGINEVWNAPADDPSAQLPA